jgi:hypothetical protein
LWRLAKPKLTIFNRYDECPFGGKNLHSHSQQRQFPGDDRERISRARQAAEALFTLRPPVREPSAFESARQPRVLKIIVPPPVRHEEVAAPVRRKKQAKRRIPTSQIARIRAWTKYGMTVSEVAELYGVAAGEIERILRRA